MVHFEKNWAERNVSNLKCVGFLTFLELDVSICLLETNFNLSISFQGSLLHLCFLDLSHKNSSSFLDPGLFTLRCAFPPSGLLKYYLMRENAAQHA